MGLEQQIGGQVALTELYRLLRQTDKKTDRQTDHDTVYCLKVGAMDLKTTEMFAFAPQQAQKHVTCLDYQR